MSLLLDALKKAADDKQKASNGDPAEARSSDKTITSQAGVADSRDTENSSAAVTSSPESEPQETVDNTEVAEELTLDPIENNITEASDSTEAEVAEPTLDEITIAPDERAAGQHSNTEDTGATSYTVSDEALSMLIYKTNREAKQSKRVMLVSLALISLGVLVSGGIYYYMDMQTEIDILERKHQIAMLSMQSKTRKETTPEKSKIIRNLVGESELDDKVQFAKKQMAAEKKSQQIKRWPVTTSNNENTVSTAVSFLKTNKVDPITEKLEQAWLAYEDARYGQAKQLYAQVLDSEKNNRDAMLGLGAIAVLEKNNNQARSIYVALLKQDPRDPIAISALASLQEDRAVTEQDENYLLNMLQKTPGDAHLNFALGNVYAQQSKWKQAQQSYFKAWQRDNENADYIFNLAVSMDQLGKQEQAAGFYKSCLSKSAGRQVSFSREAVRKRIAELSEL